MNWLLDFYNERRGILARYGVEAPLPAAAVRLGRAALVAEYPPGRAPRRPSLLVQAERAEGGDGSGWALHRIVKVLPLILLLALGAARRADGEVPTAADVAACNEQAPGAVKAGTSSPIRNDHARAASARGTTSAGTDATGGAIESSDPQIHGMEAEGAKDAGYQAAYRICMRQRGF